MSLGAGDGLQEVPTRSFEAFEPHRDTPTEKLLVLLPSSRETTTVDLPRPERLG